MVSRDIEVKLRTIRRLALGTLAWSGVFANADASIMLSEIMYEPQNGSANREWVELFNNGATSVDLGGWQFGKPQTNAWTSAFPLGTTLASGQALVLTPSSSTFDSDWGTGKNRLQVSSFPALPNDPNTNVSNATLAIRNAAGVVQDSVVYRDGSGWPTTSGNDGNSIYVLPQFLNPTSNDSGASWKPSSQGVYGASWRGAGGESENHASPGFVATTMQSPFAPSSDAAWSMVIVPDTQNYVARPNDLHILNRQMDWIVDNKEAFNIQVVLQEGDIVNRNSGAASNGVTAVQQWQNARDAFSTLNGVVPYIMATGNHDYGFTNSETRDTKFNAYFKATDNPLVDAAQGGILKGVMTPGELQNAYYEFTAPDGREMLIFSLEFWPRDSVVNWAKGIAQQSQYADDTAVLLTHSYINSGDGYWNTTDDEYAMEGGNDGQDLWNKLVDVSGNFEMTFNGHIGGDQVGYRVDQNNAGDDVHQMLLNSQFETNAGNGWLRVLEFLNDGQTVRVRTYSPHFDLYRTNAANQFDIEISPLNSPATALIWNDNGAGGPVAFTDGFAASNGSGGVGAFPASPWDDPYNTGKQELLVGFNGNATVSGSATRTIGALRVGTDQASQVIAGRNGNGTVTAGGSIDITLNSTADSSGDLIIGEGGYAGTLHWNSSGALIAQGKLRIGQGGVGTLNQNNGVVIGGNTAGSLKFLAVGAGAGSAGVYNLNNGFLRPSGGFAGTEFRQTVIGDSGATGELNVGDDSGAASTASLEMNDDLIIGRSGGVGVMRVKSDGNVELLTSSNPAELLVGQGSTGSVIQTGGLVTSDDLVRIGSDPGGVGSYAISGGKLATATDGSGAFQIARNGAVGTLRIAGTAQVQHGAELFIADEQNTNSTGRLEIIGSQASVQIGQLENVAGGVNGMSEAIRWEADANGITPLVVTGSGPLVDNRVQLQDVLEAAANMGVANALVGDGMALELNLSAIHGNVTLTLIDNQMSDPITGLFERGSTLDLYEEGSLITGTGYSGQVSISYVGGTGNDVILQLVGISNADFDADGAVNGADLLTWQRNYGVASGATTDIGDANGDGAVDEDDLVVWKSQFGDAASTSPIPEPNSFLLMVGSLSISIRSFLNGSSRGRR